MADSNNPFDNQNNNQQQQQQQQPLASPVYTPQMSAGNVVQDYLNGFLNSGSSYVQNARQGAAETAAGRGMLNSSIAAGAGQRAAIESVQPFVQQAMGLHGQREQNAFTGEQNLLQRTWQGDQNQLDRNLSNEQLNTNLGFQGDQNALDRTFQQQQLAAQQTYGAQQAQLDRSLQSSLQDRSLSAQQAMQQSQLQAQAAQASYDRQMQAQMQQAQLQAQSDLAALGRDHDITMAQLSDWAANNQFTREFNAQLKTVPIASVAELNSLFAQAAVNDPKSFTPEVVSGLNNFFNTQFLTSLRDIFPDVYGG